MLPGASTGAMDKWHFVKYGHIVMTLYNGQIAGHKCRAESGEGRYDWISKEG